MKDEDEDEENTFGVVRYPCMPSLVALQQMRNRLHLAALGRKLMKWTTLATGRELRRLAADLYDVYDGFGETMREAFILLARSRYFCPQLQHIVTEDIAKRAAVVVQQSTKQVSSVKILHFEVIETHCPNYEHLGLEKGGQTITHTKRVWLELLKRLIVMVQLRDSFLMVEIANKNATKKWNVLSKLVIPRIKLSCHYITSELEEIEREDNFRLKRFKELKNNKRKKKPEAEDSCTAGVAKKDICEDEIPKNGDRLEPACMECHKNELNTQLEVVESISCNKNTPVNNYHPVKDEFDSRVAYEEANETNSCEHLKETDVKLVDTTVLLELSNDENSVCSCTPVNETVMKEPVCVCDSMRIVNMCDKQDDKGDENNCVSRASKLQIKVSCVDKGTQTEYLTDILCSCRGSQNLSPQLPFNDKSCKKRISCVLSDVPPQAKSIESEESGICCGNNITRITKSEQIKFTKPVLENKSNISLSNKSVKPLTKVSFRDKGIQTGSHGEIPCKMLASSIISKKHIESSDKVDKLVKTCKELVKFTKTSNRDGSLSEEHRIKTVKTEKWVISKPIATKKSKRVSKIPSSASSDSKSTTQKPSVEASNSLTVSLSQSLSIISNGVSQPATESELLVQEITFNCDPSPSKCSNNSVNSCMSHFKSCESVYSASDDIKVNGKTKPVNGSEIKIIIKDNHSQHNIKNEDIVELTSSTIKIIKLILLGMTTTASDKLLNMRTKNCSCGLNEKVSMHLRSPNLKPSTCKCKTRKRNLILKLTRECSSCPCVKSKTTLKGGVSCNMSQSLPIFDSLSCTCAKNGKENHPLLPTTNRANPQECSCQNSEFCFEKYVCESREEAQLQRTSLDKVGSEINYPCKSENKNEKNFCVCEQKRFNDNYEKLELPTYSWKSTYSVKSISDSYQIVCPLCNVHISTSICNASCDKNNSLYQKSLRSSDSSQEKTKESCSCSLKEKSNTFKICCSKSKIAACCNKSKSQNNTCSNTKVDASTSTRRSDRYDVRPLRLLVEKSKLGCKCKSDNTIMNAHKQQNSMKLINKSCSFNYDQRYYFKS